MSFKTPCRRLLLITQQSSYLQRHVQRQQLLQQNRLLSTSSSMDSKLGPLKTSLTSGGRGTALPQKQMSSMVLLLKVPRREVKTTTMVHPEPVFSEEEKVLEKVLKEREKSEDLPIALSNPYEKPVKKCILCTHGIEPDYKNTKLLYQFVSPYTGMVYGRHITGLCKAMQEKVEREVRIACSIGFMSNYLKQVEFLKDPKLCDPERPVRAHKY